VIPDGEKITGAYLREHADIVALAARVVGKTPDDPDSTPWVRLTQLDASAQPNSRADHLTAFLFQIDCYARQRPSGGSPQAEAHLLGRTVRAALVAMPGQRGDAVVTGVRMLGHARRPDTDFEPARERVILTVQAWMHA
jgi:hypothetical protein